MNKIEALKKTIYNLENDVYEYNWGSCHSCNCGILAQTVTGKDIQKSGFNDVPDSRRGKMGAFARNAFCMTTDLPLPEVFQSLKDAGFTYQEILELEQLGNPEASKKAGRLTNFHPNGYWYDARCEYNEKSVVIQYLKAWVSILEEDGQATCKKEEPIRQESAPKTINVYHPSVLVDKEIVEQVDELILS